ncbi:Nickel insertion protein [Methanosarcina barkeri str. Wiesmoor]|uniref:Nickel insertion protein n=2 Tax=Methanosarcina barkeri TaxID=2208 RepID=A0A0E3QM83_METBA|nr:hypothetical protein [Methanosarcina barkeri]AKB51074.1 Nickel insertion protein [Methanosarcina barkeri str. Wiesmoor]
MQAAPSWDSVSFFEDEIGFADIPAVFLLKNGKIKLIAIGKIHEVSEGCACSMEMLVKEFIEKLKLNHDEVIIVDTKAKLRTFICRSEK